MARWQRRQDAGEAEEGSGEQDGEAAEENAPETPPKTRGSRAAAVAKAAARVDKVLDGAKGLTKNTKKSSKNSGKKNTRKRKKVSCAVKRTRPFDSGRLRMKLIRMIRMTAITFLGCPSAVHVDVVYNQDALCAASATGSARGYALSPDRSVIRFLCSTEYWRHQDQEKAAEKESCSWISVG